MDSSQRGSVLLAVIAGIILLSVLGLAMVSLMTDSAMIGVNGKETMQAGYLAESGKELVRTQTAKLMSGELMAKSQSLETASKDKGIAIGNAGTVRLTLSPSWFRWYDDRLNTTGSGWYQAGKGTAGPTGERRWLAVTQNSASLYQGKLGTTNFGTTAADVYLVGRTSGTLGYDSINKTLTATATADNDFAWFPESGGLIGLVGQPDTEASFPTAATIDSVRLTYDRKTISGQICTFTGVTPLSEGTISLENKDIALGQYFRVLSKGTTANGARAVQIWHTNGRNSLRRENGGAGHSAITPNASGSLSPNGNKPSQELHKEMQDLFGNNITGSSQGINSGYTAQQLASGYALTTKTLQPSAKNHFLLPTKDDTTDYWFGAATKTKTAFTEDYGGAVQISVFPPAGATALFAGTLFRLTTLKKDPSGDDSDANRLGDGVAGLGMGIAYGKLGLGILTKRVSSSSINPALLPGFFWDSQAENYYPDSSFDVHVLMGLYKHTSEIDFLRSYKINPMIILWAYDDSKGDPPGSLRWLAATRLTDYTFPGVFSRIVVQVQEENGVNQIRGWIEKNAQPSEGIIWPNMKEADTDPAEYADDSHFSLLQWDVVNTPYASLLAPDTVSTSFATGTTMFERTGFFEGVYSASGSAPSRSNRPSFRNFAAGTVNAVENGITSGLTPGIAE